MATKKKSTDDAATADADAPTGGVAAPTPPANATTLDSYVDAPSEVAPGDAPADTTDPTERASSVTPDMAAAAAAGHLTVNAVVPVRTNAAAATASSGEQRVEKYESTKPDGTKVTVEHNIDTGATRVL